MGLFTKDKPAPAEGKRHNVREADDQTQFLEDYSYTRLTSKKGAYTDMTLPARFTLQVMRDSHWMFKTHGLARRIILRHKSIIAEGGWNISLDFDKGYPTKMEASIRERIDRLKTDTVAKIQRRMMDDVQQGLEWGEGGIRAMVDHNGEVKFGTLTRYDVYGFEYDDFDKLTMTAVILNDDKRTRLSIIHECMDENDKNYGYLVGDCIYTCLDDSSIDQRGTPILQDILDELRGEKRFRMQAVRRAISRLALYMTTVLTGAGENEIDDFTAKHGTNVPEDGYRFVTNEEVENKFLSANLEASDVNATIQTNTTLIAGAKGFPLSWFGYGDGSTKATAETQQTPAAMDANQIKVMYCEVLETLVRFVIDSMFTSQYLKATPMEKVWVTNENGEQVQKKHRDCIHVTVNTIPLEKTAKATNPLAATDAVIKIIAQDDTQLMATGVKYFDAEHRKSLLNFALAYDGVGTEIKTVDEIPMADPNAPPKDPNMQSQF